ncbi:MAG: response regulator [Magnetococcales bacterium]|nr:response regulator [Magnetococcales bacterium]
MNINKQSIFRLGPLGRRNWERLEYQTAMELIFPDGRRFRGLSQDVSLNGILILLEQPAKNIKVGEKGEVLVVTGQSDGDFSFPFEVKRLDGRHVALGFKDKQSAFGIYVTHDMMLELLTGINNSFSNSKDLAATLNTGVNNIQKYLQSEGASLFLIENDGKEVVCCACAGPVDIKGLRLQYGEGIVGKSIMENRSIIVQDTGKNSDFSKRVDDSTGYETKTLMCVPIRINDEIIGALEIINKRGSGMFAGQDQVVLTALASATGMAIHNARQSDALKKHSDELEEMVKKRTKELTDAYAVKEAQIITINKQKMELEKEIEERKKVELALQRAKQIAEEATLVKSEFLASMSHEIRTPMNGVLGMIGLCLQTVLSDQQQDYLTKAYGSAESLLGIINDILDFSKIEAGKMDLENVPFKWDEMMEQVNNVLSVRSREKGLELLTNIDGKIPPSLIGDPLRIKQVITNLGNNAIKFTHSGTIVITAKLINLLNGQAFLEVSVTDSGIGMTAKQIDNLFKPFSQADSSTTRKYGGTGLGLTICQRLVTMMAGRIWVKSRPGEGSKFTFSIRLGYDENFDDVEMRLPDDIQDLSILVVDDCQVSSRILLANLESLSRRTVSVTTGTEALSNIARGVDGDPFDLVFMDGRTTGVNGLEVARQIHEDLHLETIPKIILTTVLDPNDISGKSARLYLDGVLGKPFTPSLLRQVTMQAFGHVAAISHQMAAQILPSEESIRPIWGARILLVEDNEINRQIATELLEMAKMRVIVAENGQVGVQKVQSETFDAVLMDLQMPVMDGYTAAGKIRKDPANADLPIIAMTANAMAGDREKCLAAGMNDHVAKPIDPKEMFGALLRWIKPDVREIPKELAAKAKNIGLQDGESLPDLPGIDTKNGLLRVGGLVGSYLKLLAKFVTNQGLVIQDIQHAIANNNQEVANRLAHTLKGVSGTIGAVALQESAGKLEAMLSAGRIDDALKLLPDVAKCFDETIATIQNALPVPEEKSGALRGVAGSLPAGLSAQLQEIAGLAEQYRSDAVDMLATVVDEVAGHSLEAVLKKAYVAMSAYDFETAASILRKIVSTLDDKTVAAKDQKCNHPGQR